MSDSISIPVFIFLQYLQLNKKAIKM